MFSTDEWAPLPPPNVALVRSGREVLGRVKEVWEGVEGTYYGGGVEIPSRQEPPV